MSFIYDTYFSIEISINQWWPWLSFWNDLLFIQFFIICTYMYTYNYNNIYYTLLYTFINFFLMGVYLSMFQIEFFTAFLWLVECSVLFVFLLLLFYLNIKGTYTYVYYTSYVYLWLFLYFYYILLSSNDTYTIGYFSINLFGFLENYYESIYNPIMNDLFGFSISYYFINVVEFILIGFLLLIGSVICVNLYQFNKSVGLQNYNNFLTLFDFFNNFVNFLFLRRQNLINQGNQKASLKFYKK